MKITTEHIAKRNGKKKGIFFFHVLFIGYKWGLDFFFLVSFHICNKASVSGIPN